MNENYKRQNPIQYTSYKLIKVEPTNIVSLENITIGSIIIDFVLILAKHGYTAEVGNCLK